MKNIFIYTTNVDDETSRYKTILPIEGFSDACFSSDNKTLWLADYGTNMFKTPLTVLDAGNGNIIRSFEDYASNIYRKDDKMISIANHSDLGLSGINETYIRFYDEKTMEEITTLYPAYEHLTGINNKYRNDAKIDFREPSFSPDGKYMILQSIHDDGRANAEAFVFVYDTETYEELWHIGCYDANDPQYTSFMEETDGYEGTLYMFAYPALNDKVLVSYVYVTSDYYFPKSNYSALAFEIRDIRTGEVLDHFVPEGTYLVAYAPDRNQIGLFADEESYEEKKPAYVFNTDSFENLADKYVYKEPASEETEIDLGGSIIAKNNDLMLLKGKDGSYSILRIPTLKEAINSARIILNGRQLSESQKEKYFLTDTN